MEIQANPLELTLDELIALNKTTCDAEEERDNISVISYAQSKKSNRALVNQRQQNGIRPRPINEFLTQQALRVNNRLRNLPKFGNRPIHKRLGYDWIMQRKNVQQSIKRARYTNWIRSQPFQNMMNNPTITFRNPNAKPFISPLTRRAVTQFDHMTNSSTIRSCNGSARSAFSFRPPIVKHSIRKCLNPAIQRKIQELMRKAGPSFEEEFLADFRPTSQETGVPTDERFSTYI